MVHLQNSLSVAIYTCLDVTLLMMETKHMTEKIQKKSKNKFEAIYVYDAMLK